MQQNHNRAGTVAAVTRTNTEVSLRRDITEVAARVLADSPKISHEDSQFLRDVQRAGRYEGRWIVRLVELAAACPNDSTAFALSERFAGLVRARRAPARLSLVQAIREEAAAEAEEDVAVLELAIRQDDPGVVERALAKLTNLRSKLDGLLVAAERRRAELAGVA